MVASVSHTKNYFIGPEDGWVLICDATTTNLNFLRISGQPATHTFLVYADTVAPTITTLGIAIYKHPFEVANYTNTNASKYWIKVPSSNSDGKIRFDVYADGGVLQ